MKPRIIWLKAKKLLGYSLKMNLIQNRTGELWRTFSPNIAAIPYRTSQEKISMQIYPADYFQAFHLLKEFEKWATVEVTDYENIPSEMKPFLLEEGLYAVFDYKGNSNDNSIFQYIFSEWLPNSEYTLDNRPHFEVLGEKYQNNDPDSEEEIWIPIKKKEVSEK